MRLRHGIAAILVLAALVSAWATESAAQVRAWTDLLRISAAPDGRGSLGVVLRPSGVDELCVVTSVDWRLQRLLVQEAYLAAPATGPNPNRTTFAGLPQVGMVLRIPKQTTRIQAFASAPVNEGVVCEWRRG